MAVAAIPGYVKPGFARLLRRGNRFVTGLLTPARPVLANLASIPLTVAGWACIDAGMFAANTVAGLIVTGITLMVLEHQIADER
jgi:hypothetical protein